MLDVLRRIVQEVNSALGMKAALNVVVDRVQQTLHTSACAVYLVDQERQRYTLQAARGFQDSAVGQVSLAMSEGLVGLVGSRAEPLNLGDVQNHPKFQFMPEMGEGDYHSFLGVPIIHHRNVLGILIIQGKQSEPFAQEVEAFLVTLAAQLAGVCVHAEATGSIFEVGTASERNYVVFKGVSGAPGAAIGTACVVSPHADLDGVPDRKCQDIDAEKTLFKRALNLVRRDIRNISKKLSSNLGVEEQLLFDVYLKILEDNALGGEVLALIDQGHWAQGALRQVIQEHARAFQLMSDPYLQERGSDIRDLGMRILAYLQARQSIRTDYPDNTILIGEELTPAVLGEVPTDKLAGLISISGSSNSHIAILARAMEIPTVVGVDMPFTQMDGMQLIVDGYQGKVFSHPTQELIEQFEGIIKEEQAISQELEHLIDKPAVTPDGQLVALRVNTSLLADVARAVRRGAEGVGLYRTEVSFMMTDRFPSEGQQYEFYREHLATFAPHPVTMRTLDVGGDKPLPYFPIEEDNPFLGWRGVRMTLDHPEIFLVQLRAMLKASVGLGNLRIMLPMVSNLSEIDAARYFIRQALDELIEEGVAVEMPEVGVMIEVPAAVYQIEDIVQRVDFISVGSNDLTQYLLAVDRNNANVMELYHAFHPAVLKALKQIVDAGRAANISVSICGELAGDPRGAVLLMAMGYEELSMAAVNLLRVKAAIRKITLEQAQDILSQVMKIDCAEMVESTLNYLLLENGIEQKEISH